MNITFMIGNGFDLGCGLKSTYSDIYNEYIKTASNAKVIDEFKKMIEGNIGSWADFEMAMAKYSSRFSSEEDFLICLRDFRKFVKIYISNEQRKFWERVKAADFLTNKPKYTKLILRASSEFYRSPSKNRDSYFKALLDTESVKYSCVNFNYTNVFEMLFKSFSNIDMDIVHVHGSIDEDIVLGIDNISQLPDLAYHVSTKMNRAFVKTEYNAAIDITRIQETEKKIAKSDIICIFGLKLGDSDFSWRENVLSWLIDDVKHHLFVYKHSAIKCVDTDPDEQIELEEAYRREVLTSWGVDSESQRAVESQVHIPIGRNIFNISGLVEQLEKEQREMAYRMEQQNERNKQRSTGSMTLH